jgi:hypothetical protein
MVAATSISWVAGVIQSVGGIQQSAASQSGHACTMVCIMHIAYSEHATAKVSVHGMWLFM